MSNLSMSEDYQQTHVGFRERKPLRPVKAAHHEEEGTVPLALQIYMCCFHL